jgi:vacuolar-type H+-ATPase subunit F/Vma7
MSLDVRVVCRPEVAGGFALAGLPVSEAATPVEAGAQVSRLRDEPGTGVILLESGLYDALPEDLRREIGRRPLPMIVPFPAPSWETRPEDAEAYIVELLRQVVGYRVRLK